MSAVACLPCSECRCGRAAYGAQEITDLRAAVAALNRRLEVEAEESADRIRRLSTSHRARKATWLYAYGVELPLRPSPGIARLDQGFHSADERARFRAGLRQNSSVTSAERRRSRDLFETMSGRKHFARLGTKERSATPPEFAELLLSMARTARREAA